MENVEVKGGNDGITHCILLIEMARVGAWFNLVPGSPLVEEKAHGVLRVNLIHDVDMLLEHFLDLDGLGEDVVVILVAEVQGRTLAVPVDYGIVVEGESCHTLAGELLHQHLGPVVVIVGSAARDLVEAVAAEVAKIGAIAPEKVGIVFRSHVSAAAPGLVAYAEVLHVPRLLTAVRAAQVSHRALGVGGHILNPVGHLLHAAAAHVAADIRLNVKHFAEVEELVGTEAVVLERAAPVVVGDISPSFLRAYAVHPVVVIGEASARPAHYRHFQGLERIEDILAVAFHIRHAGILAYPQTSVNAASEVFGELTIDFSGNGDTGTGIVDTDGSILGEEGRAPEKQTGACEN